ncbi:MAG: heavy metal-associated domain-containing protein [Anaerolineales bacterium]|nr:heavy metal-associated domain-containing protein [Anaerolineales bacterium]
MKNCHVETMNKQITPEERENLTGATLEIMGMGCGNCANRVRNSLLQLHGVVAAQVDHISGLGLVQFNPTMVSPRQLTQAVSAAGGDGKHEYAARLLSRA